MNVSKEGYLSIGQILRPQGLLGQVKIRPDTDDPGRFSALSHVFLKKDDKNFEEMLISDVKVRSGFVYLTMGDDKSVEDAEKRRDTLLYIPREESVPLETFENFIVDLIGCTLIDTNGNEIGVVKDVLQPGANDVYVVKTSKGTLLVPALKHVILSVDVQQKRMLAHADKLMEVSIFED
ncbi:MAG: 16S rRNA processing protein RimM [Clostridiales bacterium]|nr:16S rRNA processing protein RimM [Clostridiales bacterium]